MENIDLLAFGAHPDDIEISAGGTIANLTDAGLSVAFVDFTRGESGTRGTPEIRLQEAKDAAEILNVKYRENLVLPDAYLEVKDEFVEKVVKMIRFFRPESVIMTSPFDRHPDHEAACQIVREAMFKSGLEKYETHYHNEAQEKYRIRKMYSYMQSYDFSGKPDFYVDITDNFEKKLNSIRAYKSQVYIPGESADDGIKTRLYNPDFLGEIESRARYFGRLIGTKYAEAFKSVEPIGIKLITDLL